MDKYRGGAKGRTQQTVSLESGPDQRLRHISENEASWKIITRRRVDESYHGFICGRVAPLEVHRGENQCD